MQAAAAPLRAAEQMPLADAADVLSGQLQSHLHTLAELLRPHIDPLESRFLTRLRRLGLDVRQRAALVAITLGSAARVLQTEPLAAFFEQLEYSGRRLAKLNLPPSAIVSALAEYDRLLTPLLRQLSPEECANFHWVREQLQFCSILTLNNAYYQVREAETHAFYELTRVELESRSLDELLARFLQTLMQVSQAAAGALYLYDEKAGAWVQRAHRDGPALEQPIRALARRVKSLSRPRCFAIDEKNATFLLNSAWSDRYVSCWSIPLAVGGRTAGLIQFAFDRRYEWLPREVELLTAAAERCLMAAEKTRLMEDLASREEQIRQLAEHMLHVEEIERRRISRELHDEAGQSLLCIRLQIEMIEQSLPEEWKELKSKLAEARNVTEHTILEMRRLIAALSPAVLEQLGLCAALRQLVHRFRQVHPCKVRLHLPKQLDLPKKTEIIVYRLVQECFNNIGKHAAATKVNLSVVSADGMLRLQVEDNGVGFQVEEGLMKRDSFGLAGMRERVALMGGQFEVQSRPSGELAERSRGKRTTKARRGTEVSIALPIPADRAIASGAA